jgi:hypothetical protein
MKITQFGHGICSASPAKTAIVAWHPTIPMPSPRNATPTNRYGPLPGGRRAPLLLGAHGHRPACERPAGGARDTATSRNLIVESNSIVEFLTPDLYLVVLDFAQADFKASSRRFLSRADACVTIERDIAEPLWNGVARGSWDGKPRFPVRPPQYVTPALAALSTDGCWRPLPAGAGGVRCSAASAGLHAECGWPRPLAACNNSSCCRARRSVAGNTRFR